jgi:CubicO group peptidase (beta-lactamase class C family)
MKSLHTFFILTICISLATALTAQYDVQQIASSEANGLYSDSLEQMNRYFHTLVDEKRLAGIQTAVIAKGKLVHFDTYGYADIEQQKKLDEKSIFRIFSMTKPIVSVALMQLYEQGKFDLYDPLHKYIPEFKDLLVYSDSTLVPAKEPIKIIDLLRHTSGYSYGNSNYEGLNQYYAEARLNASENNKAYVQKVSKIPLQFEPGTARQYGVSTNICGYLIELLSGKSLDVYLQEHIFEPLQMNDTHFKLPQEKIEHFTVGYRWSDENGLFVAESATDNRYVSEVALFNGGGGLVSTTFDYLKFCQMLLDDGRVNQKLILKPETLQLMFKDHLAEVRKHQENIRLPQGEAGFGLGFAIKGDHPDQLKNIFGWGGAVGTYFKIDKDHDLAYVMMIQLSPHRHLGLRQRIQDFINASIKKN